jgi:hypothetical protein
MSPSHPKRILYRYLKFFRSFNDKAKTWKKIHILFYIIIILDFEVTLLFLSLSI